MSEQTSITQSGTPERASHFVLYSIIASLSVIILGSVSFGISRYAVEIDKENALAEQRQQPAEPDELSAELRNEIEKTRALLDAEPHNPERLLTLANLLYDAQAFAEASPLYERYLAEFHPENPDARIDYAYTLFRQNFAERALEETQKALEYKPDHPIAWFNIGVMHYQQRKFSEAGQALERCIELAEGSVLANKAREILQTIADNN